MENSFSNSGEGMVDTMLLEDQQLDFFAQNFNQTGPGDEEEEGSEAEEEGEDKGSNDEDPPLDEEIVHSPVPLQTGGKP
jgi:hypothetical protein